MHIQNKEWLKVGKIYVFQWPKRTLYQCVFTFTFPFFLPTRGVHPVPYHTVPSPTLSSPHNCACTPALLPDI
jgi:hypothetical protein